MPASAIDQKQQLDPDRPFARMMRGEPDIVIDEKDLPQWIEDWLDLIALTAEELIAKHDANDLEGFDEHSAWGFIGAYLREGRYVRSLRPSA